MTGRYVRRDDPAAHAWSGNFEPLAKYIEAGGELNEQQREFLVALLRDKIRFKRGNRRTFVQKLRDTDAALAIRLAQIGGLTRSQAVRSWLDCNPGVSEETLKKMLQRAARDARYRREQWNARLR